MELTVDSRSIVPISFFLGPITNAAEVINRLVGKVCALEPAGMNCSIQVNHEDMTVMLRVLRELEASVKVISAHQ